MTRSSARKLLTSPLQRPPGPHRGFTLVELLVTLAVALILTAMAVPLLRSSMRDYQLRGAVSSVTGAVQAARYRALAAGYPFRLVLNKAAGTYLVQSEPPPAAAFSNIGNATPLSGSSVAAILNADTTLEFHPSGRVLCPVGTTDATTGVTTLTLTLNGKTETITVSRYGNINVTP